jgi:very-short-patch-repair endonuclease
MRLDQELLELAERQHGHVGVWQARAVGLDADEILRIRRSDDWRSVTKRVLVRTGVPTTDDGVLMAAMLDVSPGGAVCGPSAAWMWGVPGFRPSPVHVVRPRGIARRTSVLAAVHEVIDLHPSQVKVVRGISVVSPARVVCELAGSNPRRAERVLDWMWSERLVDGRTFRRTVEQLATQGRPGSTLMRELDEARGPGYVPPASGIERRFKEICDFPMERQVNVGGEEWCGRVDFKDPELPLVVEVQSEKYHASLVDKAADARRKEELELAGFAVVEVWDHEVWHTPDVVRDRIRKARWTLLCRSARTRDGSSTDL